MKRISPAGIWLACVLAGLAGFVDAIGFLQLGGIFVSFMSGNSTRLGIELALGAWGSAARLGMVVGLFFAGACLGGLIGAGGQAERRPLVLGAVAFLLAAAALLERWGPWISGGALVLAMGLENAVFQRRDGTGIGLTYMTGAVVKAGQEVANAILGGDREAWIPHVGLWASLVAGAALGAWSFDTLGLPALWAPAFVAALLAPATWLAYRRGFVP